LKSQWVEVSMGCSVDWLKYLLVEVSIG